MRNARYPGPKPFQAQEHSLFFGREKEVGDLYRLVGSNKIVVLFGKSGFGKSSLIQAGLMPQLSDNQWVSVPIRFGLFDQNHSLSLCDSLRKQLDKNEKLKYTEGGSFLKSESLWHEFKKRHDSMNAKTVLILDQFEEFFSYPIEQQEAFQREIADVLYTTMPQSVVDAYEDDSFERQSYLATPMDIRILIAIRADRLSLLHGLKNYLPAVLYARYELKGLTPEQARNAIEKPALATEGDFNSPPFTYEPEALDWMTEQLAASKAVATAEPFVEAVQLQIICQEIENKIRKGSLISPVTKANLPEFEAILENYYRQELSELDPSVRYQARIIVEEKLISGQLEDGSARRATVDGSILSQELSIDENLLMALVDAHLLRREPNSVGSYSYEICHDTLLEPILKARKERQNEEARTLEAKRQDEEAKKSAEERMTMQQKLDEEKRKRLFANRLVAVFVGITILVISLAMYAWHLYKKAQLSGSIAQVSNYISKQRESDALSLARWAYEEDETPETEKALSNAFYAFLDKNNGCVVQKIELPITDEWIAAATFVGDGGEAAQKLDIQYKTFALDWDLKDGQSHRRGVFDKKESHDSVAIFNGQLRVKKTGSETFVVEDRRQNPVLIKTFKADELIEGVSISPDGQRLMTIHKRIVQIYFWQSQIMPTLRGHGGDVVTAVFSPDNKTILTASKDSTARLWNRNGELLTILRGGQSDLRSAIFSADGAYILTTSIDKFLRVWRRVDGRLLDSISLNGKPQRMAMSEDGKNVLVNLNEKTPVIFHFLNDKLEEDKNTKLIKSINWIPYQLDSIALAHLDEIGQKEVYSKDKNFVAKWSNKQVQIMNGKGEVIVVYETKKESSFSDISFSPDNQYFIVSFDNSSLVLPLPKTIDSWLQTNNYTKMAYKINY